MASWLTKNLDAFKYGAKCELGFKEVEPSELAIKPNWEFGPSGIEQEMPNLADFRVTVMFHPASGEESFLNSSVISVIQYFPAAYEVVIVVVDPEVALFEEIAELHRESSPFPLRVVGERARMDKPALQQKFAKVSLGVRGVYVGFEIFDLYFKEKSQQHRKNTFMGSVASISEESR